MVRARVHSLCLAQSAIFAPSAVVNMTELLTIQIIIKTSIEKPSYGACTGVLVIASAKRVICTVSNCESDRTANCANVGTIIKHAFKSPPTVRARVYSLWLAQSATFARSMIANLTELLTVQISALSLKHAFKSDSTVCTRVWLAQSAIFAWSAVVNMTELLTVHMWAQSLKRAFKSLPTLSAQVYALWLAQSAIFARSAVVNMTELLTEQIWV